ncbi:MAG TPA: FAD-dependent oxidoreductase [Steroidobacteraceae bacterium]|nr:FAD-dependent oxidoreductase [Steroidobacteraceae bacterium]
MTNRRAVLKSAGSLMLLPILPPRLIAKTAAGTDVRRVRMADAAWPSKAAWKRLHDDLEGNLIPVSFPIDVVKTAPDSAAARQLSKDIHNPYYIADQPGLTETLGWVDAWATQPSAYAVVARHSADIAAAVSFARDHNLRLVIKGRGHSYLGASNAPDSLMIWTRHMTDIETHAAFVPRGCEGKIAPQPAVTMGAGTYWLKAYEAVTTQRGRYVQGGGCTTVGVAGLILGGGFGSFSKRYGTAAASLLEAEVVTADGRTRIANAYTHSDLFWALKGGGGGTFAAVSKLTVRTHELPEYFGITNFKVKAPSDEAYRMLLREFVRFYAAQLFNEHWGEQAHVRGDNVLEINMLSQGLDAEQSHEVWQPFLDWVRNSPYGYSLVGRVVIGSLPARRMWDAEWLAEHWPEIIYPRNGNPLHTILDEILAHATQEPLFRRDQRPSAAPSSFWWNADAGQVGWFIWGYDSLWMPASLLASDSQARLADALFAGSRHSWVELHFNKGLAGARAETIAAARDTATNPAVLSSFALAIVADGEGPAYPGIPGHSPDVAKGRAAAEAIERCIGQLRAVTGQSGSYVNETNYFETQWQQAFWGGNYSRLIGIKQKYDPDGLFFAHHGVGSEGWSRDGFTKL